jgi:hypothetical protein
MINNKIVPAHILRAYIWEVLKQTPQDGGVSMTEINTLNPILPIEDEPKVAGENKPYAIYGYAENNAYPLDQIREGVFSLRVMSPDFGTLTQIINTVGVAFESADIATEAVNRFSAQHMNGVFVGMRFTFLKTSYIEGGEAAQTEGGPVDGVVNITYKYINHLPIPIPVSAQGGLWT